MKKLLSTLLLSTVFATGSFSVMTAYADHHKGADTEKHDMKADANNDGKVSYEEFKDARLKHMEEHFKRRDANSDGFIDADEKKAAREKHKAHKKSCKRKNDSGSQH